MIYVHGNPNVMDSLINNVVHHAWTFPFTYNVFGIFLTAPLTPALINNKISRSVKALIIRADYLDSAPCLLLSSADTQQRTTAPRVVACAGMDGIPDFALST